MELLSIDPLGRRRQPLGSDLRPDRASQFQSRLKMESIRLSIEIESIDRRAWSGVGVELESRWNLEFDRLKRRVATITWDWIPILDGVGYPYWQTMVVLCRFISGGFTHLDLHHMSDAIPRGAQALHTSELFTRSKRA